MLAELSTNAGTVADNQAGAARDGRVFARPVPSLRVCIVEQLSQSQGATDERLSRSLDVEQEEAQKSFELVDLALSTASDLVAGMSDADIRSDEGRIHSQLKKLVAQIPAIQSIWIYGKDGRPLVSSDASAPRWAFPTGTFSRRMSETISRRITAKFINRFSTRSRSLP